MKRIVVLVTATLIAFLFHDCSRRPADSAINVHVDGSAKINRLDGVGVNANTRSWNGKELEPALNLLLDSMHATLWRVVVESVEKWEDVNDNADPFKFNWDYYNKLYETPKFQKVWGMIHYLNEHGITDNLMINIMGPVPVWMGKKTIKPEFEDEYVEMMVSFFYYGRNKRHIQFGLVSPTNESDWHNEGPEIDEKHYASVMRKLIDRMASLGMGDVRYVGPDPAMMKEGIKRYVPEMMKDSVIMSKLAHVGLHSYGGYYANADSAMKHSPYPKTTFWITEWNAWRNGLDDGKIGVYDYKFAGQCVDHLLDLLGHGATGAIEWEAYDSYYEHHAPSLFSYWGILGYDPQTKTYSPRKHFWAIQQVSRFIYPGSDQIAVTENIDSLRLLAFEHASTNSLTLVGINTSNKSITLTGDLANLPEVKNFEMTYTNDVENLRKGNDVPINDKIFTVTVLPNSIFTLTGRMLKGDGAALRPEPMEWYAGDIHVHRNCGDGTATVSADQLAQMMEPNDLSVISVLADMGNGEVKVSKDDLPKVNGKEAPQSRPDRVVEWDAEWHWDATYSNFSNQALGGHLVLLGLQEAHQIWDESPYKILEWARAQQGISGFCHFEYLNDSVQHDLNCCIPIEFPVEAALGTIDFVAEDVYGVASPNNGNYNSEAAMNAYYKLLNCGFRLGLAAGTDYPCNNYENLGTLLTYVKIDDKVLTYRKWVEGIKNGKTVVARNGHDEFIDLTVDGKNGPGDVIAIKEKGTVSVEVNWTARKELTGRIELVSNGEVIASQPGTTKPGQPLKLRSSREFTRSGWICARRMDEKGHQTHTAPVYVSVNDKPIRASAADAQYYVKWIDNLIQETGPGGKWNRYFTHDLNIVQDRYRKARDIYKQIIADSQAQNVRG